jgi:hypothetical protein
MIKGIAIAPDIPFKKRLLEIEPDALFIIYLLFGHGLRPFHKKSARNRASSL